LVKRRRPNQARPDHRPSPARRARVRIAAAHFEIRKGSSAVDPLSIPKGANPRGAQQPSSLDHLVLRCKKRRRKVMRALLAVLSDHSSIEIWWLLGPASRGGLCALQNTCDIGGPPSARNSLGIVDAIGPSGRGLCVKRAREYTVGRRGNGARKAEVVSRCTMVKLSVKTSIARALARKLRHHAGSRRAPSQWHGALCAVMAKEGAASSM